MVKPASKVGKASPVDKKVIKDKKSKADVSDLGENVIRPGRKKQYLANEIANEGEKFSHNQKHGNPKKKQEPAPTATSNHPRPQPRGRAEAKVNSSTSTVLETVIVEVVKPKQKKNGALTVKDSSVLSLSKGRNGKATNRKLIKGVNTKPATDSGESDGQVDLRSAEPDQLTRLASISGKVELYVPIRNLETNVDRDLGGEDISSETRNSTSVGGASEPMEDEDIFQNDSMAVIITELENPLPPEAGIDLPKSGKRERQKRQLGKVSQLSSKESSVSGGTGCQPANVSRNSGSSSSKFFKLPEDADLEDLQPGRPIPLNWANQLNADNISGLFKIVTWNVNGLRSVLKKKDFHEYIKLECPDILCLNETKIDDSLVAQLVDSIPGYKAYYTCAVKKGYSGVAILVNKKCSSGCLTDVIDVSAGMNVPAHDQDGRLLTLSLPKCSIVASYIPNAGEKLKNLTRRVEEYDPAIRNYLEELKNRTHKPVIWCGDLNVAHRMLDIWSSVGNQKSAGHSKEERLSFVKTLDEYKWVDVFRDKYPNRRLYTFWPARSIQARKTNKGWRLDYFLVTRDLLRDCVDIQIRDAVCISDHCPVVLYLNPAAVL